MIDTIDTLQLSIDTGLLVLIWLVQLVIYPSFELYNETRLKQWHPIYTRRVTFVVLPLMITQLGLSVYQTIMEGDVFDYTHLSMVLIAWIVTFTKAVPLHRTIDSLANVKESTARLIQVNKMRTIVWSIAWIISIVVIYI